MRGQDHDANLLRGHAARGMVAEDARWAMDLILSANKVPHIRDLLPLLLGQHLVRIAHEGAEALRSSNANVGMPELATLLDDKFAAITARARHTTKLLDNSSTDYNALVADLEEILREHRSEFTGKAHRWLRRFKTDLGLYFCGNILVGAKIPAAYRLGISVVE